MCLRANSAEGRRIEVRGISGRVKAGKKAAETRDQRTEIRRQKSTAQEKERFIERKSLDAAEYLGCARNDTGLRGESRGGSKLRTPEASL